MSFLKSIAPIIGGIVGTMTGVGPGIGSGIGALLAGGDIKDAALTGLLGQGIGSLPGLQSATGAAATKDAIAKAALPDELAFTQGTSGLANQAAKGGIFGSGITAADIGIGSSILGALGVGEEKITDDGPRELESRPDYKGRPVAGLFVDSVTGINYDTAEELEDAITSRREESMAMAMGGIVSLNMGGLIEGPGTGTSDSIKAGIYQNGNKVQEARLSDEEFVMTKKAVAGAGNGDTSAGAKRMYAMMDNFERMA